MSPTRRSTIVLPLGVLALFSSPSGAQGAGGVASTPPAPPITATAAGEVRVTPDRALLQLAVHSQGESAAAAAADNATKQTRVIEAVKAAGVAPAQIRTSGYNVHPEYVHSGNKPPRVTGYRAGNTVLVEVRAIGDIGKIIDAALGAGANTIGSLGLYAANTDSARREAVGQAVTKARAEASAAAVAAGGSLGSLLELTVNPGALPRPLLTHVVTTSAVSMAGGAPMPTPIETGESVVAAVVHAKWQFVPGQR
jgi:uncharacterized protein YggE